MQLHSHTPPSQGFTPFLTCTEAIGGIPTQSVANCLVLVPMLSCQQDLNTACSHVSSHVCERRTPELLLTIHHTTLTASGVFNCIKGSGLLCVGIEKQAHVTYCLSSNVQHVLLKDPVHSRSWHEQCKSHSISTYTCTCTFASPHFMCIEYSTVVFGHVHVSTSGTCTCTWSCSS